MSTGSHPAASPGNTETGVLLLYTGSPDAPEPARVASYLREFLMDPYVLDMPWLIRALLVKGVIAPLRARKSAAKYRHIWLPAGSPLKVYTDRFLDKLGARLASCPIVAAGAYGSDTIEAALSELIARRVQRLVVLPLFPHYAGATRGSLRARLDKALRALALTDLEIREVPPFYTHSAYIDAVIRMAQPLLDLFRADHVVFSYHGLPVRQAHAVPEDGSKVVYEQQCIKSTTVLAHALGLEQGRYSLAYQSRFGRGWLTPATDKVLVDLAFAGKKRVALLAPSFVTDCLETLEELDFGAKEKFLGAGGQAFLRVPALNDYTDWVTAAAQLIEETFP